ncbi:Uncharacterised protein [Mycobacterium tuberculosis]|nr:Uncharacterised protein [Mycobacterium tuberculosis]
MARATMMSTKASTGLVVCCRAVRMGTVASAPSPPNSSMLLRRPMRSDSAPNTGCMHM